MKIVTMKYSKHHIMVLILSLEITLSRAKNKMESFIVGGDYTTIKRFPHSVFLSIDCNGRWICGSSVLTQNIVLTAAHCLADCNYRWDIEAFAGNENLRKMQSVREITKIIVHDGFDELTVRNDIALGFTNIPFRLGNRIKRVIIRSSRPRNPDALVAGWGIIDESTEEEPAVLKAATQKVRSLRSCSGIGFLRKGMLCAESGTLETSRPASGDSGSALITKNYQQIGLVSFRVNMYPRLVIYTDVSYYYEWIEAKTKLLFCA